MSLTVVVALAALLAILTPLASLAIDALRRG